MDDTTVLETLLFAPFEVEEKKQKLLVLPNLTNGLNVTTQNGEVLYSIQPGVSTEGASMLDPSGVKIASVREGVHDSVVYDFGIGETAIAMPDIFNGRKIVDHGEGVIGFTQPAFGGCLELQDQFHQPVASLQGSVISPIREIGVPDFATEIPGNTFGSSADLYEFTDTADDVLDVLDTLDVLGDLF